VANTRTLAQLLDEDLIERRVVGQSQLRRWVKRSRMDLDLASHAATKGDTERAMTLVYEAGLRACIAILARAGYRLRSGEGHHRAALEAALAIVGPDLELGISRLDDARRQRNQSLYGTGRPVGAAELQRLTSDVEDLVARAPRL
jgi:hypothetical protein